MEIQIMEAFARKLLFDVEQRKFNFLLSSTSIYQPVKYDAVVLSGQNEYLTEVKTRNYYLTKQFKNEGVVIEKYKIANLRSIAKKSKLNFKCLIVCFFKPDLILSWDVSEGEYKTGSIKRNDSTKQYYTTATTVNEHYLLQVNDAEIFCLNNKNYYEQTLTYVRENLALRHNDQNYLTADIKKHRGGQK